MNKFLLMICASFLSTQAMAGAWRYGCIGQLPDKTVVNFNRSSLGMVSMTPPPLYGANVDQSKDIQVLEALDSNSGLEHEMNFRNASGEIVKLIEIRSNTLFYHEKNERCTGTKIRTLSDKRMLKTYKFLIPGESSFNAKLKCYDINISACG